MALYMVKRILPPWRDRVALVLSNRSFYRGTTTSKIVMPLRPCTRLASTTTAAPAATAAPVAQPSKLSSTPSSIEPSCTATVDVIRQMEALEEDALRVLYEPRPNTAQLVAIVRGLVQLGGLPSHGVVRALVNHLTSTRDAQSSAAMLSLLKRVAPPVLPVKVVKGAPTDADSEDNSEDDPIAIVHMMHLCLVNALCRRRDLTGALGAVADMERDTGRPAQAKVFVTLLKACAISTPPMLREADTVWEQVEERGFLTSARGVQQELFASRMMVYASCAGYPPFHETSPEESQQVLQQKVDGAWNDMLAALSAGPSSESGDASEWDGTAVTAVTAASWIARANAMSLCSRGSDAGSGSAMSRSLEALESYLRAGGNLSGDSDMAALAEVVRGLARSGRQEEVVKLLWNDALAAATAFDADTVTDTGIDKAADRKAAVEKVRARTAATHSSLMPERLLRALGARGAGRDAEDDQDERRAYGTSLLEAIEGVALEARLSGKRDLEGVDARLTAVLQAILAASHFLGRDDSGVVDVAVQRALDAARAGASAAASGANARDVIDSDRDVESREWSGPGVAALSLVALLRVSKQPRQGIAGALEVLQEMHDRKMSPPPTVAGQLDAIVRRHGTKAQKRRAMFLLAEGLERVGSTEQKQTEKVMTRSPTSEKAGVGDRAEAGRGSDKSAVFGLGKPGELGVEAKDEIGAMVRRATESRHRAGKDFLNPEGVKTFTKQPQMQRNLMKGAAEALEEEEERLQNIAGARSIELACALATEDQADYGTRVETGDDLFLSAASTPESHRGFFRRVIAMAERGRAHSALSALRVVDGRKKGNRVAVPYRVYALLFRALAGGYSARDREELELAASPTDALQWLLRGLARQGYKPGQSLLNFGLEAFAVAAKTKKVQEGGEKARRGVCTAALDFLEGMKTGWNGLHPPVQPNVVSYSIVIKTMCRLWMFDEAFQVLDLMERNGCTPDRVTYSTLIHGLSKAGDNDGAWEVLVTMTNKGITPHSIAIDGIVDGFVRSGEVGEAISFAQHAFNQYGSPPTPAKFCRMMHAAAELDDGKHEARRAVIVAEQLWPQEWKGEGGSSHPVLGHPQLKGLLREKGVFDGIGRL